MVATTGRSKEIFIDETMRIWSSFIRTKHYSYNFEIAEDFRLYYETSNLDSSWDPVIEIVCNAMKQSGLSLVAASKSHNVDGDSVIKEIMDASRMEFEAMTENVIPALQRIVGSYTKEVHHHKPIDLSSRSQETTLLTDEMGRFSSYELLRDGDLEYSRKNIQAAFGFYLRSALMGDSDAMVRLGDFYLKNSALCLSREIAMYWYEKASGLGNRIGKQRFDDGYTLYLKTTVKNENPFPILYNASYRTMVEISKNKAEVNMPLVIECTARLADKDAEYMYALGQYYENGTFILKSATRAKGWYSKAAEKGFEPAILKLKQM